MSCPPLPPVLAMLPVSSVASFPPPYMDFFLHGECDIDKQGWCHAAGLSGQHSHGQSQPTCVPCSGRLYSECHHTGANPFGSETEEQRDSCVRSLCCRSLPSGAMFWRPALHVFLAKQSALPGYNVLLFTWTQRGFLTLSVVKAETWWLEKCVFLDLYATKSNIVGTVFSCNYAQFLLTFLDQNSKYKDVVFLS